MRWSQSLWSEERLVQAVNETGEYFALPYGPSGTAPDNDIREFELYFERLEEAGLGQRKRPDLLIFKSSDKDSVEEALHSIGGVSELPFTSEDAASMRELLSRAVVAIECENSLWKARQMPSYGVELRPMRRLDWELGLPKNAVLPTVIAKEEDMTPLQEWQRENSVEIHVWHVFYDMAFGLSLDEISQLIEFGKIEPTVQTFQSPGGATTRKAIFKVYYHYAYHLADSREEPDLIADQIIDKNGHILPYVRFDGGSLELSAEALEKLNAAGHYGE